jgi:hypothetical protein
MTWFVSCLMSMQLPPILNDDRSSIDRIPSLKSKKKKH